uniref:LysM and peptidoglycan-binding domain-containing protein 3-like n=1 Tax=Hirondellea gigas TaxID=1518452 RepID=A0A2P2I1S3_9CRUS
MAKYIFKKKSYEYEAIPLCGGEEMELASPPQPLLPQYEQVVERRVRTGETLCTIAINYRISVSELKRVNRLQNDSDFYALSSIKIPVRPNSELGDILKEEFEAYENEQQKLKNGSPATATGDLAPRRSHLSSCTTDDSDGDACVGYVSIQQILREKSTRAEARRFLENMQEDLMRIKEKVVSEKASLSEAAAALTDPRFVPLSSINGVDGGLSWCRLFFCAIVVLLLLPLAYFIYMFYFEN